MSEEITPPPGVPQPVFGISREALASIVAGNRAALGLPPQVTAATRAHPILCGCPEGGRYITWGTWVMPAAWCHTDGHPCPTSTDRPAPETTEVLF